MKKEKNFIIILEFIAAIIALLAIIFLIIDIVKIIPLCNAYKYDSQQLEIIFNQTTIGKIVLEINATESSSLKVMVLEAVISFIKNLHFICVITLIFIVFLLFLKIYQEKIETKYEVDMYLKLFSISAIIYVIKFLLSAASFGIFYTGETQSYFTSFSILAYVNVILDIIISFIMFLNILKVIFYLLIFIKPSKKRENH